VKRLVSIPLAAALLATCATGCATPVVTEAGYRHKIVNTAKEISSAIASARLGVQLSLAGRMVFAWTDQTVSDAEVDADSAASVFASRQPPTNTALRLYHQAETPIQDGVDALRSLRIAVRRQDQSALRQALSNLDGPSRELADLQKALG
jgi:hypothetical protein